MTMIEATAKSEAAESLAQKRPSGLEYEAIKGRPHETVNKVLGL